MTLIRRTLERLFWRSRAYRIYRAGDDRIAARDDAIDTYDAAKPPGPALAALYLRHAGRLNGQIMLTRLRSRLAVMLAVIHNADLIAYGWLQTWGPLRREFGWLAADAICLGPFWTRPADRGKGVYGRMLRHSVYEAQRYYPGLAYFVWARMENAASCRGIERVGFEPLGAYRVRLICGGLFRRHHAIEPGPGCENHAHG